MKTGPGRSCPVSYRYGARALASAAVTRTDTLWIAGGLYGNWQALTRLEEMHAAEPGAAALVYNGDFHWFDARREDFTRVNEAVLRHVATRGNVETEIAFPREGAGCGCGYPDWVGDAEVDRSNRIMARLRRAAQAAPEAVALLQALPMVRVFEVAGERVAIVHGDAESLAGWGFSQEVLATQQGRAAALESFDLAAVSVFASSHTCLPALLAFGSGRVVANNGAAGMPNFRGTRYGLATRISVRADKRALYAARAGRLHVEAHAIHYDHDAWLSGFLRTWPEGSDAHQAYFRRLVDGPGYELPHARRAA